MRLTRTSRIVLAVAGLGIALLLLFPPFHVLWIMHPPDWPPDKVMATEEVVHKWIGSPRTGGDEVWSSSASVHRGVLIAEIAVVVIIAGGLMLWLGERSKRKPDKDA